MVTIVEHPLIKRDVSVLRNKDTATPEFRTAMKRIGAILAAEAARYILLREIPVLTPLEATKGYEFSHDIVLLPVLRAGAGLVEQFTDVIPDAKIGYIGLRRNEATLHNEEYYFNVPHLKPESLVMILDPMLATGGSICSTIERVRNAGVSRVLVASVIAAPEGIQRVEASFPDVPIIAAALDRCLNDIGYILPGLGDAGDRYHGTTEP
jgi:uracil phosphoribosyltransferase